MAGTYVFFLAVVAEAMLMVAICMYVWRQKKGVLFKTLALVATAFAWGGVLSLWYCLLRLPSYERVAQVLTVPWLVLPPLLSVTLGWLFMSIETGRKEGIR